MQRFTAFIGPSYTLQSVNADAQRCVNWFPELNELGTGKEREVASFVQRPGLVKLSTMGAGPIRGLFYSSKARAFAVSGSTFYEVTDPANPVNRGTLVSNTGRVGMADNGVDLLIVDGVQGKTFRFATNVLTAIADPEFIHTANNAFFLDQYLIVNEPGSGKFWFSALSSATSWDGLDFAQAEGSPDNLVEILVDHRELWLYGDRSIEVFFNTGDADNPFQRIQGAFIEEGAVAGTVGKIDDTIFYVAVNDKGQAIVKRAQGYRPARISTHAVELAIAGYGSLTGATSYTYQDRGHSFYCLNFPGAATTWCFDAATGLWHERAYTPAAGEPMQRDRVSCHVFNGTRHLVGDYVNGNLYEYDFSAYTDDGAILSRMRRAPHLTNNGARAFHHTFQLDVEAGVGLATGQGSDPKAILRWSNDGGHIWQPERWATLGKMGEYQARCIFRRLGQARQRVYEVLITDPVKVTLLGAYLEIEAGTH